jgi:hypothetical protein
VLHPRVRDDSRDEGDGGDDEERFRARLHDHAPAAMPRR